MIDLNDRSDSSGLSSNPPRKKVVSNTTSTLILSGCEDNFDFRKNQECQAWVNHLLSYVKSRVKPFADTRIYPYRHGAGTYLAVDIDPDNPNDEACVIVTIFLSGDRITLDTPTDGQLDIELPGIIDALWLASNISKTLGNPTETIGKAMAWQPDKIDVKPNTQGKGVLHPSLYSPTQILQSNSPLNKDVDDYEVPRNHQECD